MLAPLSLSLNRPKLGPKGKDGDGGGEAGGLRGRGSRSLANEVGRNDHDDGGEVHDALIRDRQIQMDEKKEKPKLIASARESVVGREGYFGAFLHSKYNLPRDYLLLPFPLGITAPELCCSSQDLQPSGRFGGVSSSPLDSFVKTR